MDQEADVKCAIWVRVSTHEQSTDSQKPDLQQFVQARGLTPVKTYVVTDSAWYQGREYRATLEAALDDAWKGEFSTLVVWAFDRINREGALGALSLKKKFRERGCRVLSVKEPWLSDLSPEIEDILVAFVGWMAQVESQRRSDRVKAGIEAKRLREPGWTPGRQAGSFDRKPRRKSGYYKRWEEQREREQRTAAAKPEGGQVWNW